MIPSRSAPSAKILMGRSDKSCEPMGRMLFRTERGRQLDLRGRVAQNNPRRVAQIHGREMRPLSQRFLIPVIDKDRAAAGRMRAIHIAPAITDQITLRQLDPVRGSGAEKHTGFWLPAIARLPEFTSRMETNLDAVERGQRRA